MAWFILKCGSSPTKACNYKKISSEPSCCGNESICAIEACPDEHEHPIITDELRDEMLWALYNRRNSSHVHLYDCLSSVNN